MVRQHVNELVGQLDAYAASDYSRAFLDVHDAYRHMFEMGRALAAGIAARFPDRFATVKALPATDTAPANAPEPSPATSFGRTFACTVALAAAD
jgi:hypothetical protein